MYKVSVIIPVYNAGNYLGSCIDSLLSQTFTDYEIILINDGSTDNSLEILRKYEASYNRIIAIDKPNEGVSATRNLGIKIAKGDYIMFCDSDDFVEKEWISILYNAIINHPNSLVDCEYFKYNSETKESKVNCLGDVNRNTLFSSSEYYLFYKNQYSNSVWNRIYEKERLIRNKIFFDEQVSVGEDVLFNIKYLKTCDSFFHICKPLYYWNDDNTGSLSRKFDNFYFDTIKELYFPRFEIIGEKDRQSFVDEYFFRFYCCLADINLPRISERIKYGRHILKNQQFRHALKHSSEKACGKKLKFILMLKSNLVFLLFKKLMRG